MTMNWFNVNMPTIIAVAGAAIGIITYVNHLDARIEQVELSRSMRSGQMDKTFADISAQLSALNNLPYRMGQVEANVGNSNQRMDRIAESVLGSVEGIKKDVAELSTQVRLVNQKQDILSGKVDSLDVPRQRRMSMPPYLEGRSPFPLQRVVSSTTPLVPLH